MLALLPVYHLSDKPQRTQYEQYAHEGWQVSKIMVDRYEAQTSHAKEEDKVALPFGNIRNLLFLVVNRLGQSTTKAMLHHEGRHHEGEQ